MLQLGIVTKDVISCLKNYLPKVRHEKIEKGPEKFSTFSKNLLSFSSENLCSLKKSEYTWAFGLRYLDLILGVHSTLEKG